MGTISVNEECEYRVQRKQKQLQKIVLKKNGTYTKALALAHDSRTFRFSNDLGVRKHSNKKQPDGLSPDHPSFLPDEISVGIRERQCFAEPCPTLVSGPIPKPPGQEALRASPPGPQAAGAQPCPALPTPTTEPSPAAEL
ncbi:hypothetical protein PAL_GLEAN10009387 [Pteropus alecto]|uniref:Uncharacterized protein n=1 Tax=Pteropus alecto TaxID=9402 RepID=L5L2I6_PTEAL|nr:hypothetical protein PAL_GLEAN10009387 [Pteropus alecto]